MLLDGLLLAALLLGHACILITTVNVTHGLGLKCKAMDPIVYGALALVGIATVVVVIALAGTPPRSWPFPAQAYAVACLGAALVGFPLATASRSLRKGPVGTKSTGSTVVDLAAREGGEALIGTGVAGRMLGFRGNQALHLTTERWDVEWPGLPASLDGLKILHLTDLHFAHGYNRRYFEAVADEAAAQEADLVVFTGDLIDDEKAIDWIVPVLSRIRGRLGQYAILGNHDIYYDTARIRRELAAAGFADVDGRWRQVDAGGWTLAVGGTSAPWGPDLDPAARPEADACLVLSHTPDRFARLAASGADLVLAGHNHGGQFRLPLIGPVLMPSRFSRRFDMGFFRDGRTLMYVSRGVGGKHPLRYGCPPEITTFSLRCPSRDVETARGLRSHEGVPALSTSTV